MMNTKLLKMIAVRFVGSVLILALMAGCRRDGSSSIARPSFLTESGNTQDLIVRMNIDYKLVATDGPLVDTSKDEFVLSAFLLADEDVQVPVGHLDEEPALELPLMLEGTHSTFDAVVRLPEGVDFGDEGVPMRFRLSEKSTALNLEDESSSLKELTALKGGLKLDFDPQINQVALTLASTLSYRLVKDVGLFGGSSNHLASYGSALELFEVQLKEAEALVEAESTPNLATYVEAVLTATKFEVVRDQVLQSKIVDSLDLGEDSAASLAASFNAVVKVYESSVKTAYGNGETNSAKILKAGAVDPAVFSEPASPEPTSPVSETPVPKKNVVTTTAPKAPTLIAATGGEASVTVNWSGGTADSYRLYWSTTNPVSTASNVIPSVTTPYQHTGLTAGTSYYYAVSSVVGTTQSSLSTQVQASTDAATPSDPSSPTVSFDANGGSGTMTAQSIADGASANLTSNSFTKSGAIFSGWATTSDGAVAYTDGQSYTMGAGNVTLYAVWTNTYTISFNANTGSGTMTSRVVASGASINLPANTFTKASSSFAGWAVSSDGGVVYNDAQTFVMGSADVTLYVKWAVTSDLLINYKFDNQSCADSVGSNDCTATDITFVSDDNGGYAASFNGTTSSMVLPNDLIHDNTNFTIMMRFKASSSQYGSLFGYQNVAVGGSANEHVPMIVIRSDGKLRGELWTGTALEVISSEAVNDGNWHTVYFSASAGEIKLYLDGVAIGSNSGTVQHLGMSYNQIGVSRATGRTLMPNESTAANNWFYFNGLIDDVYLYQSAL